MNKIDATNSCHTRRLCCAIVRVYGVRHAVVDRDTMIVVVVSFIHSFIMSKAVNVRWQNDGNLWGCTEHMMYGRNILATNQFYRHIAVPSTLSDIFVINLCCAERRHCV